MNKLLSLLIAALVLQAAIPSRAPEPTSSAVERRFRTPPESEEMIGEAGVPAYRG